MEFSIFIHTCDICLQYTHVYTSCISKRSQRQLFLILRNIFIGYLLILFQIMLSVCRYQFDPSPKIQQSMQSIWNALVTDSAKTLDKYLAEILEDLRINLTSNQWRVRESCCEALQDLLRGRTLVSNYCIHAVYALVHLHVPQVCSTYHQLSQYELIWTNTKPIQVGEGGQFSWLGD